MISFKISLTIKAIFWGAGWRWKRWRRKLKFANYCVFFLCNLVKVSSLKRNSAKGLYVVQLQREGRGLPKNFTSGNRRSLYSSKVLWNVWVCLLSGSQNRLRKEWITRIQLLRNLLSLLPELEGNAHCSGTQPRKRPSPTHSYTHSYTLIHTHTGTQVWPSVLS